MLVIYWFCFFRCNLHIDYCTGWHVGASGKSGISGISGGFPGGAGGPRGARGGRAALLRNVFFGVILTQIFWGFFCVFFALYDNGTVFGPERSKKARANLGKFSGFSGPPGTPPGPPRTPPGTRFWGCFFAENWGIFSLKICVFLGFLGLWDFGSAEPWKKIRTWVKIRCPPHRF